jgi:hypothetical protein
LQSEVSCKEVSLRAIRSSSSMRLISNPSGVERPNREKRRFGSRRRRMVLFTCEVDDVEMADGALVARGL